MTHLPSQFRFADAFSPVTFFLFHRQRCWKKDFCLLSARLFGYAHKRLNTIWVREAFCLGHETTTKTLCGSKLSWNCAINLVKSSLAFRNRYIYLSVKINIFNPSEFKMAWITSCCTAIKKFSFTLLIYIYCVWLTWQIWRYSPFVRFFFSCLFLLLFKCAIFTPDPVLFGSLLICWWHLLTYFAGKA